MTIYCAAAACDGETRVMQTSGMYRRRKCLACNHLFITEEAECTNPPKAVFFVPHTERRNGHIVKLRSEQRYCLRGHPFTESNTSWSTGAGGKPQRGCRKCASIRRKAKYRNDAVFREKEKARKRKNG